MKKIATMALTAALVLSMTGCISLTAAKEVEKDSDPELANTEGEIPPVVSDLSEKALLGDCSFEYPVTWEITVDSEDQISATASFNKATACLQKDPADGVTSSDLPQVAEGVANGTYGNGDLSNVRNCTIDGIDAIKFDHTATIGGNEYAVTTIALVKDDVLYSLMAGYCDESQKTIVADILASFRVTVTEAGAGNISDDGMAEPAPEPEPEPEPAPEPKAEEPKTTVSQDNALRTAKDYLSIMAFSHEGLVDQLEYEGFSNEDAVWAADNCGADWMEQAEKSAESYLDLMGFSRSELIDQLVYEGFTQEQAAHGADSVGL